jgi:hypothetical protein
MISVSTSDTGAEEVIKALLDDGDALAFPPAQVTSLRTLMSWPWPMAC